MRIELRVHRNGQTIFRAECDTERGSSFAEFSKLALREFNHRHPAVSLLDDDVWLKFDMKFACLAEARALPFGRSLTESGSDWV